MPRVVDHIARTLDRLDEYLDGGPLRRGIRSVFWGLRRHHALRAANGMAFALFLATIPMIALGGWVFARILRHDPRAIGPLSALLDLAPDDVHGLLDAHLHRFSGESLAPLVLLGALWIASSAFHTVMSVFESALDAAPRPWWIKRALALACVVAAFAATAGGTFLFVLVGGGPVELLHRLAGGAVRTSAIGPVAVGAVVGFPLVAGFFRIAVSRPDTRRRVWPGAAVTVFIGVVASVAFTTYVGKLARYAVFYGSLAAVAVFMVWLWICCGALLLGAEVNAQLEGVRRSRDGASLPND